MNVSKRYIELIFAERCLVDVVFGYLPAECLVLIGSSGPELPATLMNGMGLVLEAAQSATTDAYIDLRLESSGSLDVRSV